MAYISVTWIHSGLFVVLLFFSLKTKIGLVILLKEKSFTQT